MTNIVSFPNEMTLLSNLRAELRAAFGVSFPNEMTLLSNRKRRMRLQAEVSFPNEMTLLSNLSAFLGRRSAFRSPTK